MTDEEIAAAALALRFRRGTCEEPCDIDYEGCDCRLDAIAALSAAEEVRYQSRKSSAPLLGSGAS
jgi:hypothetical protein